MNNERKQIFDSAWDRCTRTLEFDRNWSNGSGMYDYAVYGEHAPKLAFCTMCRSETPGGRKLLLIGTRIGNVVVFEYNNSEDKNAELVYRYQSTSQFERIGFFSKKALDEYELEVAVGSREEPHVGRRVEEFYSAVKNK